MYGHKPFGDDGHREHESFGDDVVAEAKGNASGEASRPARQRLERLREEAWLKRQLADWDEFAFGDIEDVALDVDPREADHADGAEPQAAG